MKSIWPDGARACQWRSPKPRRWRNETCPAQGKPGALTGKRGYQVYGQAQQELARQLGAIWSGEHPSQLPVPVNSAILLAPVGDLVPPLLEKLNRGGTLALAGIYLTDIPPAGARHLFYEREIRSVTCNTRADGRELLAEAARIPLHPQVTTYPLAEANRALQDLKADRISGTGVLRVAG